MIHELPSADYEKVRPLFQPLAFQRFCIAVLAGVAPGRVFVDDAKHPQTAFVSRDDAWCFLSGNPGNEVCNRALNKAIFERQVVGPEQLGPLVVCHPEDWSGRFGVVSHPRQPIPARRRHYVCREITLDWRARIPEGFIVERMDEKLLARPDVKVPSDVTEAIDKWDSNTHPQLKDFGFVCIHKEDAADTAAVVSWATVDAIVDGAGDAGLFTVQGYRRRGLATLASAAALEHGLKHGLSAIHWTCAESNIGSIRTAKRLGLERLTDNPPFWAYHDAARVWAGLRKWNKALGYLATAAEGGWTDADATEACQEFESLRDTPQWATVLERMRRINQQGAGS